MEDEPDREPVSIISLKNLSPQNVIAGEQRFLLAPDNQPGRALPEPWYAREIMRGRVPPTAPMNQRQERLTLP